MIHKLVISSVTLIENTDYTELFNIDFKTYWTNELNWTVHDSKFKQTDCGEVSSPSYRFPQTTVENRRTLHQASVNLHGSPVAPESSRTQTHVNL